jgi:shikimate kinase
MNELELIEEEQEEPTLYQKCLELIHQLEDINGNLYLESNTPGNKLSELVNQRNQTYNELTEWVYWMTNRIEHLEEKIETK